MAASMCLLYGLSFRFVLTERSPYTLHRTINMSRCPLFRERVSEKKLGERVSTHYEEKPHPERPTILGEGAFFLHAIRPTFW
jgi:hypothetical protein